MKYIKPPLDVASQLNLLKARNLIVPSDEKAIHYLTNIGYFRLSGYMHFFQTGNSNHLFRAGTSFDDIIDLYSFDRELRLLVLDAIERIEVAVRAHIIKTSIPIHRILRRGWYLKLFLLARFH